MSRITHALAGLSPRRRALAVAGAALLVFAVFTAAAVAFGMFTGNRPPPAVEAVATRTSTALPPHLLPPTGSSTPTPERQVQVNCSSAGEFLIPLVAGRYDFSQAWADQPVYCDVDVEITPATPLETQAARTAGLAVVGSLFAFCAEVDSPDDFVEPDFEMDDTQAATVAGALVLCPDHPQAAVYRAAATRGRADAKLRAQGRLFGDGTYRVGAEVKPGTYVTRNVDGCYWERQDSRGDTIKNFFTHSAKRVVVTIRGSDYGFLSRGCGTWRPAT